MPSSVAQAQQVTRSAAVTLPRREEKANAKNPLRAAVTFQIQQPTKPKPTATRQRIAYESTPLHTSFHICSGRFVDFRSRVRLVAMHVTMFFREFSVHCARKCFHTYSKQTKKILKSYTLTLHNSLFCFLLRYLRYLNVAYDSLRSSGSRSL